MQAKPVIVVAVDFSDASNLAYREALKLGGLLHAELLLLHVAEYRDWANNKIARAWLNAWDITEAAVLTLPGTPWVQIARFAEEKRPLLLVVGSHGRRGYQPLAPGSTTAYLMARSTVPVLVVPSKPIATERLGRSRTTEQGSPNV